MFDLITRDFSNHFDSLMKAFDNDFFEGFNVESPSFEDKGDFFELRIPVEKSVQVSNVKVRVEDTFTQPIVTVAYAQRTKTSQSTYALQETLPEKANPETLKAVLDDDGNLVVRLGGDQETVNTAKQLVIIIDGEEIKYDIMVVLAV